MALSRVHTSAKALYDTNPIQKSTQHFTHEQELGDTGQKKKPNCLLTSTRSASNHTHSIQGSVEISVDTFCFLLSVK